MAMPLSQALYKADGALAFINNSDLDGNDYLKENVLKYAQRLALQLNGRYDPRVGQ